jgi:hypothetical protein
LFADSGGSRPRIRDDVAHHSDLILARSSEVTVR